jgi:transposase-like protein
VQRAEVDAGERPGTASADAKRIAELVKEVRELRRANEIRKAASAFFAQELGPKYYSSRSCEGRIGPPGGLGTSRHLHVSPSR